jgi:formylglycine-generating enzyme required for sulfatase activity
VRRECGCYPDPGAPEDEAWPRFLGGWDFLGTLEHHLEADVAPGLIDARPVTNGEFEAFLAATDYQPEDKTNFLAHWGGPTCPDELREQPVVYVDLTDARAFAAWAGKRLPTEWEWQRGAEEHPGDFHYGQVWEWTESERDDGHNRFVMVRGGCDWRAEGSIWYFPTGPQPAGSHAKFLLMYPGYDRCSTIGFRCVVPFG